MTRSNDADAARISIGPCGTTAHNLIDASTHAAIRRSVPATAKPRTVAADRPVVQADQTKWDYNHQVLGMRRMPPWRLFLWVKLIEAVPQLRPRALRRWVWHPDAHIRHAIRWY